jgi:hypothetical protein
MGIAAAAVATEIVAEITSKAVMKGARRTIKAASKKAKSARRQLPP